MLHSKEDQLLAKLQKCVGKLNNQNNTIVRLQQRQPQRYSYGQVSHQKYTKKTHDKYDNYDLSQQQNINLNTTNQKNRKPIQNIQDKQNCYESTRQISSVRNSLSKDYLTQRSHQYSRQPAKYIQNYIPRKAEGQQIRRKYQTKNNIQTSQYLTKFNNFTQDTEKPRRPLRQYQVNVQTNYTTKPKIQNRQIKQYQQQEVKKQNPNVSTPKYQRYKIPEKYEKQSGFKRNSVSFAAQSLNMSSHKQPTFYTKGSQLGKREHQKYDQKPAQKIRSSNLQQCLIQNKGNRSDRIQQLYSNVVLERSRELSSQQKLRNGAVGSISSISKKISVEQNKKNYETFQQKQVKQLNLKQILDDVGNTHQDTFTKLQKISQLNERINLRIKNIINTFESK